MPSPKARKYIPIKTRQLRVVASSPHGQFHPHYPMDFLLDASGVITGIPTNFHRYLRQEYVINASKEPSGSSLLAMTICVNDVPPFGLNYPSVLNIFTVNTSIAPLIPTVQGDTVNQFTAQPLCPMD